MKITSTVKVAEFPEIAEMLLRGVNSPFGDKESVRRLVDLIEKQTPAKQKKFWKYWDEQTMFCQYDYCTLRKWKWELIGDFCSQDCRAKQLTLEYNLNMKELTERVGA